MNEKEQTAAYQSSTLAQRAFGFVLFNLALQLFIVGFTLYLMSSAGFFNQQFHAYLTLAVSIVSTAFVAAGLVLIRTGRVRRGLFFAYYANFGTSAVLTLLYASRTISAGITLALISLVFILWLFSRQDRRWPAIALGVFGLWLVILQLVNPAFRQVDLPAAEIRPGPGMAVAFAAFVTLFLMLQARRGTIRFKLIALLSSLALASVFIVSSVVYLNYQQQIRADVRQRLLNMVSLAALQQNGDLHVALQPGDEDKPAYLEMQRINRQIMATDSDLVYVYTMRMDQAGQIYFVVDAADPAGEDFSALGDIYESPGPLLAERFSALSEPAVEEEFYTDEYGTFLSAYAPFYTSDGLQAGVIGMDILADTVLAQENQVFILIAGTTFGALFLVMLVGAFFGNVFVRPIRSLADTARQVAAGDLDAQAEVLTDDEVGTLATVFNTMTAQLSQTLAGLETRVAARTQDLQLAAQVGQRLSRLQETGQMLGEAVDIIRERFELYYTQIYLVDSTGRSLILRAGTGDVGRTLLGRQHRLPIDMSSLNGIAATERRTILVEDTAASRIHRPNPLLPETRSEMAVPLLVGERVVGVLDMQSSQPGALNPENQTAFEALAGQLAIAITNAELFAQAEAARQAVEEQARRLTASNWQEFLDAIHHQERLAFTYDRQQVAVLAEQLPDPNTDQDLAVPLQVAGSSIGRLFLEREAAWTAEDRRLITTVAQQVSQQVENLRLVAQAERYQAEAQAALRRLTREAWAGVSSPQTGYLYSDYEVKVLDDEAAADSLTFDIKVRDQAIAQIGLVGIDELSTSDQELLALVSEQLGAHLENLRLSAQTEHALAETEQQAERLAALNALSEQLSRAETVQDVLAAGAASLNQIVAADRVNVAWLVEDGQQLEVFALQAAEGALPSDIRLPLAGSALGTALSERRVVLIPDLTRSGYPESTQLVRQGLKSSMIVPLLVGDTVPGVLSFNSLEPGAFGNRERDLAIQAASLIAGTLENQDLLAQTRAALDQTEALYEVGRKLNLATNENEILEAVSNLARSSGCKQATLMYIDPDESGQPAWMTMVADWTQSGESAYPVGTRFNLAQFPLTTVMLNSPDRVQLIRDVAQDDGVDEVVRALWLKNGSHAMVIVPMLQAGRWLGLITFSWAETHAFSQQEQDIYAALTSLATPAVASRRLFAQAQSRAQREQTLRQITSLVRASTDAETIMRTAVRELGQALGRRTFIRLDKPGQDVNGNGQGLADAAE